MTTKTIPLADLTDTAIQVLCREIGAVNTARFINQFTTGFGDYTEEHGQFFGDMTVKELSAEIKLARNVNDK
jgi:hypothetical protein